MGSELVRWKHAARLTAKAEGISPFTRRGTIIMAKAGSNDVAQVQGQASELTPYDRFVQYALERAEVESGDWSAEDLTHDQVISITEASDEDALFKAMELAGLTGLQYLDNGQEIIVNDYRFVRGNLGIGVYAVINATDVATGASLSLDTGIERVLAFLRMCEHLSLFPINVIVNKKTTGSGNEMVTLSRPAKRPVQARAE